MSFTPKFLRWSWKMVFTNKAEIKTSMNGRSNWLNNTFIEQLRQSLKHKTIYLHEITNRFQTKRFIDNWTGFHNTKRAHAALDKRPPDTAYFNQL